jgi:hypothetical protein
MFFIQPEKKRDDDGYKFETAWVCMKYFTQTSNIFQFFHKLENLEKNIFNLRT